MRPPMLDFGWFERRLNDVDEEAMAMRRLLDGERNVLDKEGRLRRDVHLEIPQDRERAAGDRLGGRRLGDEEPG
jgi:hypothetical protein